MYYANIISLTLAPLLFSPLLAAIITKRDIHLLVFSMTIMLLFSVEILKRVIGCALPYDVVFRPKGAMNCTLFNKGGAVGGHPGFPSGHMAATVFVTMSLIAFSHMTYVQKIIAYTSGTLYIVSMAWSRYTKSCHNMSQICMGVIYGGLWFLLIQRLARGRSSSTDPQAP